MSRTLKRVAMDFSWPLQQIWGGYLNPYYAQAGKCPDCVNGYDRARGRLNANAALFNAQWYGKAPFDPVAYGAKCLPLTQEHPAFRLAQRNVARAPDFHMAPVEQRERAKFRRGVMNGFPHDEPLVPFPTFDKQAAIEREARRLHDLWCDSWCHHLIQADVDALVARGRLMDFTHRPRTPEQLATLHAQGAAGGSGFWLEEPNGHHPTADEVNLWSFDGLGHDGINNAICVEARCEREGVPYECVRCTGSGKVWPSLEIKQQYEAWTETEPPAGDGYQLWEDVSEGSPVSPVFASLEELCTWAADNATTFADFRATPDQWREMLEDDFVHHADENGNVFT